MYRKLLLLFAILTFHKLPFQWCHIYIVRAVINYVRGNRAIQCATHIPVACKSCDLLSSATATTKWGGRADDGSESSSELEEIYT